MGKVKQKRLRISRYSPTNLNKTKNIEISNNDVHNSLNVSIGNKKSEHGHFNKHDHSIKNGAIKSDETPLTKGGLKTAYEKITSNVVEERVTGLNMLAAFALEAKIAESIVENKMITSIANLLQDPSSQVRLAASGTLRNLCSWGSDDIIDMIIQQDIMQPLSQLLKSYENSEPSSERHKNVSSLHFSKGVANSMDESDPHDLVFIHATNLLWSLCECNEEAIAVFNRENLVNVLLKRVNPFVWSYPVSLAAADCLLCVSENNPKTLSSILPLAPTLMALVTKAVDSCDPLGLHYSVVISGVLLNVSYWGPDESNFHHMYEVLSKVIEVDAGSLLQSKQNETHQSLQEHFGHIISAQLVAFEILSNICCAEEEDEFTEYEEISDELDEEPMDLETGSSLEMADTIPVQVLEGIKYFQLIAKTESKITDSDEKVFCKSEEESKNILERLRQVRIRALQCYQNLLGCIPMEDLGGTENVYAIWLRLGQMCFINSQTDPSLLEAVAGAMRAIIEKLSEKEFVQLANITCNDLQPIFSCILSYEVPSVKANLCRMIGTLGCAVIRQTAEDDLSSHVISSLLTSIAETLYKVSQRDESLYVQAEAIDVLIDLFSDDKTDKMAAQIRLVETLREIHPQFKFSQQRKRLGDHRPLLLTVKDNLASFIKYKGSRMSKYSKMGC